MTDHTAPLIAKLTDLLATSHVSVVDVSDGCGAKFEAIIVSDKFDGVPLLERHRMVHDALSEEMPQIHALQMKTWTPAQYEAKCAKDVSAATARAGWCPNNGDVFPSFGINRCLMQQDVDAWNADDNFPLFKRAPLALPTTLSNLTYKGQSFPFRITTANGVVRAGKVQATVIADILVREVLGINTELICSYGGQHNIRMIGGCSDPGDYQTSCLENGKPVMDPPLGHFMPETWVNTAAEVEDTANFVSNLGPIGYFYLDGIFVNKRVVTTAHAADNTHIRWWETYAVKTNYSEGDVRDPSRWYDTYADVAADMATAGIEPGCKVEPGRKEYELASYGYNCSQGWYFSSHCAANPNTCVPIVLLNYAHMSLSYIQMAEKYGYKFAITWGSKFAIPWAADSPKSFLFFCSSMLSMCARDDLLMMWNGEAVPLNRENRFTKVFKTMWPALQSVDDNLYEMLNRMSIDEASHSPAVTEISDRLRNGETEPQVFGKVACDWVKSHANDWIRWISRTCAPGSAFQRELGLCVQCSAGFHSSDGLHCTQCFEGMYTISTGAVTCTHCDGGTWRTGNEATCHDCPAGTQRDPYVDTSGCHPCSAGSASTEKGSARCTPCAIGSYSPSAGATSCSTCPEGTTTINTGAILASECVCKVGTVRGADGNSCVACGALQTTVLGATECTTDSTAVGILLGAVFGSLFLLLLFGLVIRRVRALEKERKYAKDEKLAKILENTDELSFPMCLLRLSEFKKLGRLIKYEEIRADVGVRSVSQYKFLDCAKDIEQLKSTGKSIIFFSHQWLSYTEPDPDSIQYDAMLKAAEQLTAMDSSMNAENTLIWVDYCSVPQMHPRTQEMAINSLSIYSSCSSKFVAVVPAAKHQDTCQLCDFSTYNKRMWCRVEQLAFCTARNINDMFIFNSTSDQLQPMTLNQTRESTQVFLGELSCCRMNHEGMAQCDQEKIMGPVLGLFGKAYAKHIAGAETETSYDIIKECVMPKSIKFTSFNREGKLVTRPRELFGTLVNDMKVYIQEKAVASKGTSPVKVYAVTDP